MKKKYIIIITVIIILLLTYIIIAVNLNNNQKNEKENLKIVTSFYPIYIMTLNITNEVEGIEVENMSEHYTGCIHDYTLTTADLKKFENADIFIQNGHGMENFIEKIINSYPNVKIIESSEEITKYILEENGDINAHFWTSIDNNIMQVEKISNMLKQIDSKNSDKYEKNTLEYITKLEKLKEEYKEKLERLKGKKVVSLNEAFSYLLKSIELDEILISTDHEQSTISAEEIKNVIEKMKQENIKTIIIGEDDNSQNAETIKSETNAKIYKLKDGMSGDSSLDSYINIMQENLEILSNIE